MMHMKEIHSRLQRQLRLHVFFWKLWAKRVNFTIYLNVWRNRCSNKICFSSFYSQILEKSLRFLFETRDLSLVKKYVQRQCSKLMEGRASLQDFTFAKEYRGMKNYKPGACVPALELTRLDREWTYERIKLSPLLSLLLQIYSAKWSCGKVSAN